MSAPPPSYSRPAFLAVPDMSRLVLEPSLGNTPTSTNRVSSRTPQKLTWPKVRSAKAKSARQHNATNSRLLTLPPELRNKIYRLVLGDNTIHVYDTIDGPVRSTFCCSRFNDDEYGRVGGASPDREEHSYQSCHSKACSTDLSHFLRQSPRSRIHLGILATCSQIYAEAALIPFAYNAFSFCNDRDLVVFMSRLVPSQYQSIRAICLPGAGRCIFEKTDVWGKLSGLRRLSITVPIRSRKRDPCAHSRMILTTEKLKTSRGELIFESLKRLNLEFFQLNVVATNHLFRSCPTFVEYQAMTNVIELDVLKGWDEEAHLASGGRRRSRRWLMGTFERMTRSFGRGRISSMIEPEPCVHRK
ncbi:hypothetical protein Q7P37_010713 [Cladosporium fusiforme]